MKQTELRRIIRDSGMTQKQLAEQIGVGENTMTLKLSGEYDFTWSEVLTVCEILGIENPVGIFPTKE